MKPRPGKSFQFASLSTRNGAPQFYWKELSGVSQKVALSALETHGSVEGLLAGESSATIGQVLDPSQLAAVRAVFKRLVGEETLARFAQGQQLHDSLSQVAQKAQAHQPGDVGAHWSIFGNVNDVDIVGRGDAKLKIKEWIRST